MAPRRRRQRRRLCGGDASCALADAAKCARCAPPAPRRPSSRSVSKCAAAPPPRASRWLPIGLARLLTHVKLRSASTCSRRRARRHEQDHLRDAAGRRARGDDGAGASPGVLVAVHFVYSMALKRKHLQGLRVGRTRRTAKPTRRRVLEARAARHPQAAPQPCHQPPPASRGVHAIGALSSPHELRHADARALRAPRRRRARVLVLRPAAARRRPDGGGQHAQLETTGRAKRRAGCATSRRSRGAPTTRCFGTSPLEIPFAVIT